MFPSKTKFRNFDLQLYLAPPLPHHICLQLPNLLIELSFFHPATIAEVSALLSSSPDTSCDLDPIPTSLLKQCKSVLLPTITNIINLSLSTGVFPDHFKNCSVHPLLKKSNLDKENLSNYRPISHLSYTYPNLQNDLLKTDLLTISMKTTSRSLSSLPTPNSTLLKPLYLLYTTTLSEPWVNSKSLVCVFLIFLPLLTLWPYHSFTSTQILVWFHWHCLILDSVLPFISFFYCWYQWHIKSPPSKLLYGVPQGSVLGPLLFILYTTPLSSIISQSSVNHKLCWRHSTSFSYHFQLMRLFRKYSTLAKYYIQHFFMDGFKLFISQLC